MLTTVYSVVFILCFIDIISSFPQTKKALLHRFRSTIGGVHLTTVNIPFQSHGYIPRLEPGLRINHILYSSTNETEFQFGDFVNPLDW